MLAVTFYKNKFKNNTNRKGEEHMGTTEKVAICYTAMKHHCM